MLQAQHPAQYTGWVCPCQVFL